MDDFQVATLLSALSFLGEGSDGWEDVSTVLFWVPNLPIHPSIHLPESTSISVYPSIYLPTYRLGCRASPHGRSRAGRPLSEGSDGWENVSTVLFWVPCFFTLVTGPRRSLSLKLSDTRVFVPQIRARGRTGGGTCRPCPSGYPKQYPTPYTLHPTPYILHPTPYTLHPTPCTLHPTPYTLHPTPYTPNNKPKHQTPDPKP